jgi:hypothetical protein
MNGGSDLRTHLATTSGGRSLLDRSDILPSVLHKPRKYRIEPNPIPSRINGMIFSLNL